jgi:hypothetical protein
VKATRIPEGKRVAIVGSYDAVGDWQVKNAVSLESAVPPIWTATVKVKKNAIPFEYKYIITDDNGHDVRTTQFNHRPRRLALMDSNFYRPSGKPVPTACSACIRRSWKRRSTFATTRSSG